MFGIVTTLWEMKKDRLPERFRAVFDEDQAIQALWSGADTPSSGEDDQPDRKLVTLLKLHCPLLTRRDLLRVMSAFPDGLIQHCENGRVAVGEWSGTSAEYIEEIVIGQWGYEPTATGEDLKNFVKSYSWIAQPWLPKGTPGLLVSSPGLGKTRIMLDIGRRLMDPSLNWFDGQPVEGIRPGAKVLWCDTEAFQGALTKILEDCGIPEDLLLFPFGDPLREVRLDAPEDLMQIKKVIAINRPALVVLDSLRGSHTGEENDSQMQLVLRDFSRIVQAENVASIISHHRRKPPEGEPDIIKNVHSVRGSGAIVAQARVVLALDKPDPGSDEVRLHMIKNNLASPAEPMGLRITESEVLWGQEPPTTPKKQTRQSEAEDFLREALRDGPRRGTEVEEEAKQEGISVMTLRRAAKKVGVDKSGPNKDRNYSQWELSGWSQGGMKLAKQEDSPDS